MALLADSGVTLMRLDYAESSQVLVIFTRAHGKVRAIAKGVKRSTKTRFAVGIDLLEIGDCVFSVRQPRQEALAILTEWKQRAALSGLREKLSRLYAAEYAAEVTAALTGDWDPHPELYDGLVATLRQLNDASDVLGRVVDFQLALLGEIGLMPEWRACVSCRRAPAGPDLYFSSFEGGVLCRDCEAAHVEKRLLRREALEVVLGHRDATRAALQGAFETLNYHAAHLMGREPRLSAKVQGTA